MRAPRVSFVERIQSLELANGFPTTDPNEKPPQQHQQQPSQQPANQLQQQSTGINADVPMGDPITTIAQMLQLNLTSVSNPEQQSQMVVQAVEALVLKLHELTGQPTGEDVQQGEDEEFDDPNAQEVDEYQEGQEGQDDPNNPQEEPEDDDPEQQQQVPPRRAIAASLDTDFVPASQISGQAVRLATTGRKAQILQLAKEGYVTPIAMQKLIQRFCSPSAIDLSLSLDENDVDSFDEEVEFIQANGKVVNFGEQSSHQSQLSRMKHNGQLTDFELTNDELITDENPLVASANARKKKDDEQRKRAHAY